MILPPPVTSDCTLDHVEAYLDRINAARAGQNMEARKTGAPCGGEEGGDRQ